MMKKRLLSSFLCLCMALPLLPATAWASSDITTPRTHAVGVDTTQGAPVIFTALGSATTLARGHYYVEADKELTAPLTIPADATVDLCLNGHALKYVGEDKSSVIKIAPGGTLNICDCNGDGGSHTVIDPTTEKEVTIAGGLITGGTGVPENPSTTYQFCGGGVYMSSSRSSDPAATLRLSTEGASRATPPTRAAASI